MKLIIIEKLNSSVISNFKSTALFLVTNAAGDVIAVFKNKNDAINHAKALEIKETMESSAREKFRSDALNALNEYRLNEEAIKKAWKRSMEEHESKYSPSR